MKRIILIVANLLLFFASNNAIAQEIGITREMYIKLCGVWHYEKVVTCRDESIYSWGKAKDIINGSTVFDLGEDRPFFFTGGMGQFNITKIFKEKDKFVIRILFRDSKEYNLEVFVNDDQTIIFHDMKWFKDINLLDKFYGNKYKYYKISGPTIRYIKPKIENLRLRSQPSADGKILRMLKKDEKLLIIMKGKEETIDKVKGNWIKVLTEKEEMGWCFDGYLENIK
jgi:hypothetical protein